MKGILIAAHGSRSEKTQITLENVVAMVRKKLPERIIVIGYMEFSQPDIQTALSQLVEMGVTEIKVVPYFLFEGIHIQQDIPREIARFEETHQHISITLGNTLGEDERLADILVDRIL